MTFKRWLPTFLAFPIGGYIAMQVVGSSDGLLAAAAGGLIAGSVIGAGQWLDQQQANRDKAVQIAAGRDYFNQDPNIIRFVMENPTDRVTYGDLRMIRSEFEELMQLSIEAGTIKHPIAYETYRDERFAKAAQPAAINL